MPSGQVPAPNASRTRRAQPEHKAHGPTTHHHGNGRASGPRMRSRCAAGRNQLLRQAERGERVLAGTDASAECMSRICAVARAIIWSRDTPWPTACGLRFTNLTCAGHDNVTSSSHTCSQEAEGFLPVGIWPDMLVKEGMRHE